VTFGGSGLKREVTFGVSDLLKREKYCTYLTYKKIDIANYYFINKN
jgi:hypothetical protein